MAYNAVRQRDDDDDHGADSSSSASSRANSPSHLASPISAPQLSPSVDDGLFLENTSDKSPSTTGLGQMVKSIASRSTKTSGSYDMIESDDYEHDDAQHSESPVQEQEHSPDPTESFVPLHIPRPRPRTNQATYDSANAPDFPTTRRPHPLPPIPQDRQPILRTASGSSVLLRHPTPDLQTLQGAYTSNIRNLEASAERLSMTSSIEDAIRELHMEQKRSDSRRSSLLSGSPLMTPQDMPPVSRQFSNNSIIEMNKISRSGGATYSSSSYMKSPRGSLASKSSRYGSRPEPELEGRPLDSFVTTPRGAPSISATSPVMSRTHSIAEEVEESGTMTRSVTDVTGSRNDGIPKSHAAEKRPKSPTPSTSTIDHAQKEFAAFDGVHNEFTGQERKPTPSQIFAERTVSQLFAETTRLEELGQEANHEDDDTRRFSSGNRLSVPRPQTYADPDTGQQMVYYPAPVPMILNLPPKLSKMPSSTARNKRRSQVLSSLPPVARQSALWLPDVLEGEGGLDQDPSIQEHEYVAQHQRMSMGGRRTTEDLKHLPPQLRASAYFDQPSMSQKVELKEQSAVATLDSILDASAHAPVTAFTDHAFAGHLGNEVYGKSAQRDNRSSVQKLGPSNDQEPRKRLSSLNILKGKRASSIDLLADQRSSTMPNVLNAHDDEESTPLHGSEIGDFRTRADGGLDEDGVEDDEEDRQYNDMYHGAPTTLLAELQLRKQQQKYRTRPVASAYPNGMHSTLLEMDAVLQVEQKSRKQGRVKLAWEGAPEDDEDDDEDVPLGLLYANKAVQELPRPLGLMEKKERDDNEPLSARRDRLQGRRPGMPRSATMLNVSTTPPEDEDETLAQRIRRLKAQGGTATGLPTMPIARPVSGDFASEMMSQFGGNVGKADIKGKGKEISTKPPNEEEETLGQRRLRIRAELEARAMEASKRLMEQEEERPAVSKRRSMADILQVHPAAGASRTSSYGHLSQPRTGLLGLHEQQKSALRSSTMQNFENSRPPPPPAQFQGNMYKPNMYNQGGIVPAPNPAMYNQYTNSVMYPQFAQPSMQFNMYQTQMMSPFANPYAMGYATNATQLGYMPNMQANPMANMLQMGNAAQPLNQGQIDMVERWRQSVRH